jgi:hypothetical protein
MALAIKPVFIPAPDEQTIPDVWKKLIKIYFLLSAIFYRKGG